MQYRCGTEAMLGDEIMVGYGPEQKALARIVAIGRDTVVDSIDRSFYEWAKRDRLLDNDTVVVEWMDSNPLAQDGSTHAKVGKYFMVQSLCCETFVIRQNA